MSILLKESSLFPNLGNDIKLVGLKVGQYSTKPSPEILELIEALNSLQEVGLDIAVEPRQTSLPA